MERIGAEHGYASAPSETHLSVRPRDQRPAIHVQGAHDITRAEKSAWCGYSCPRCCMKSDCIVETGAGLPDAKVRRV